MLISMAVATITAYEAFMNGVLAGLTVFEISKACNIRKSNNLKRNIKRTKSSV